jgi:hypothetical protein
MAKPVLLFVCPCRSSLGTAGGGLSLLGFSLQFGEILELLFPPGLQRDVRRWP